MKARVFKNTGAYMLAGLAPFIVNFFMLPVYTRFMTPEDYGILALLNSLASFVLCFTGLQLATSIGRFYFDYEGEEKYQFFSTMLYGVVGSALLLLVPLHFAGEWLTRTAFPRVDISYYPYTFLVLITAFCSATTVCMNMMLRVQEKGTHVMWASLFYTVMGVMFGVYFVVLKGMGAHGALLAGASNGMAFVLTLFLVVRRSLRASFRVDMLKSSLKFSLPMIPQSLGSILFLYVDKLILGYYVPLAMIGLYSIADRISVLLRVIVNSFGDAVSPNFMRESVEDKQAVVAKYKNIITKWAVVISCAYLVLALFTEELIQIMTPDQYHAAYVFVPILLGAYVFKGLYNFAVSTVMFEKKTLVIPVMSFVAGTCNAVLNILLIPRFGTIAAAWTTLLSYVVFFLLAFYFSNRYYPLKYDWPKLFKIFGTMLVILLVVLLLRQENAWVNVVIKAAGVCVFVGLLVKWDHGKILDDIRLIIRMLLRKPEVNPGS